MAAKVKFFVTNPKGKTKTKKKIDEVNILIRFTNGRQFDLVAPSLKQIKPSFWNNESGKVREVAEFTNSSEFQKKLKALNDSILDEFDNATDKTKINKRWLEQAIDKHYNPERYKQDYTLFEYIQLFIDNADKRINTSSGNPVGLKSKQEYKTTFDYLKKYASIYGEPNFIDMDLEFYNQFVDFLRFYEEKDKDGNVIKSGLAVNTIGKRIKTIKTFLNDAKEKGFNSYIKYQSKSFKKLTEESDNIYLNKEELNQFYQHDFSSQKYLERVRDLFIVGCWTGLRFSDLQQITPDKIQGNLIRLKQKKTGDPVIIPLHHTVIEILKKYDGKLPKQISIQKYNDYLKDAAKIAELNAIFVKTVSHKGMNVEKKYPKHELISSHTARRSFCTNAYKDNIPTLSIMSISGHKTEKAFLLYIKVDKEEHAKKVLEMWQKNAEHLKIVN
jgi:integrase